MAGKGDAPRPMEASRGEFAERWERTFGGGDEPRNDGIWEAPCGCGYDREGNMLWSCGRHGP